MEGAPQHLFCAKFQLEGCSEQTPTPVVRIKQEREGKRESQTALYRHQCLVLERAVEKRSLEQRTEQTKRSHML